MNHYDDGDDMPYRPEWWPTREDGSPSGILDLCEYVHGITTDQVYPYFPGTRDLAIRALEHARDNWKNPSSMYDDAVRRLVIRTLNERKPKVETPPDCIRVAVPRANPNNS